MSYKMEIFFQRAVEKFNLRQPAIFVCTLKPKLLRRPTGRLSGVLLHGAALGDKGILAGLRGGASEAALDSGRAQGAQDLALSKHVVWNMCACGCVCAIPSSGGESAVVCGLFREKSFENGPGVYSGTVANQTIDDSNVARLCKAPSLPDLGGWRSRGLTVHVKSRRRQTRLIATLSSLD